MRSFPTDQTRNNAFLPPHNAAPPPAAFPLVIDTCLALQLSFCIIDMFMNVLKGRELRRREAGIKRKLRDCAGTPSRDCVASY